MKVKVIKPGDRGHELKCENAISACWGTVLDIDCSQVGDIGDNSGEAPK